MYECLPGYKRKTFQTFCLETSKWADVRRHCQRKSCVNPKELLHGSVLMYTGVEFGSTVTYSCDAGYRLIGDPNATCVVVSGNIVTWDTDPPLCESIPCAAPPAISNGDFSSGSADSFSHGTVVRYRCHVGRKGEKLFDLVGEASIYCTSKDNRVGEWSGPAPRCVPRVKCPFPEVKNGIMKSGFRRSFSLNDSVMFTCQPGFTMKGSGTAWCQADSSWSPPLPTCFQGCLSPPRVRHGHSDTAGHELFPPGREVTYSCEPGYALQGVNPVTCTSSGTWSHTGPTCEAESCADTPARLPHGRVLAPPSLQLGAEVSFVCDMGYRLIGHPTSQCVVAGPAVRWSNGLPVCEPISCDPPPPIENGWNSYTEGVINLKAVIRYSCPAAFRLIGDSVLFCSTYDQVTGVWDKPAPRCEYYNRQATCKEPVVPDGSRDRWSRPPYRHGNSVSFTCHKTFTMRGNRTVWCQANSTWGPNPLPICERDVPLECPPLPAIPHGNHTAGNLGTFAPGLSVTYNCEPGFLLNGKKTLRCLSSGRWSAAAPTCREAQCPPPGPFPNGQVQGPRNLSVGETMMFRCNPGYWLLGQPSSQCVMAGQQATWTRMPVCEEILCPPPPSILNGHHTGSPRVPAPFGSNITYTCDPDPEEGVAFELQGERTLRCTSDGQRTGLWSGPAPQCVLSGPALQCTAPRVRRGRVLSGSQEHYSYNDTVRFACEDGFTLRGSPGARCTARGTWEPAAPVCEKECQSPPEVPHGHWVDGGRLHFPPGTSVTYSCTPGHVLEGEGTVYCSPHGEWMPAAPRCRVAECEPEGEQLFERPRGQFVRPEVNSSCEDGYRLGGSVFQLCRGPAPWFVETRLCEEITCPPPPTIANGSHTGSASEEAPYGATVTYTCSSGPEPGVGFKLVGQPVLHCTSLDQRHGVWSGPAPACLLVLPAAQCPPVHVLHGRQMSDREAPYSYNYSVEVQCEPGFTLKGSRRIRCKADGSWDPEIPTCEKGCGPPARPLHGRHTGSSQALFVPGTSVDYSCDPGFLLVGSKSSRCAPSGTWSPSAPRCEETLCQPVGEELQDPPARSPVVAANTSCPEGYQLVGHTYWQCQDTGSGVWFQRRTRCEAVRCLPPPVISHGRHTGSPGKPFLYGHEVSYKCDQGFSLVGVQAIRCTRDAMGRGSWSAPPPRCELLPPPTPPTHCPAPEVRHGRVLSGAEPPHALDAEVLVACDPGFVMNGSREIRCRSDGAGTPVWVPGVPTCIRKGCHRPAAIPNGNHTGGASARFSPGMSVLYSCEQGYLLVGAPLLLCTHEGAWSQPPPSCKEVNCSFPAHMLGARQGMQPGSVFQYGAIVTVACEDGYTLEGSSQSQCQDDHRWDPPLAKCRSQGLSAGFILVICLTSIILCRMLKHRERNYYTNTGPKEGELSLEPGVVLVALVLLTLPAAQGQCAVPEQLPFAKLTKVPVEREFPVGARLSYMCRPGFHGRPFSITCLQSRTWSTPMLCKRKACSNPRDLPNGKMTIPGDTTFGSTITYTCNEGFRLIGESSTTCVLSGSTVTWDSEPPLCESIPCGPPPSIANGFFMSSNPEYFPYGAVVTYHCKNLVVGRRTRPARLVGERTIYCTSKDNREGIWSGPAPQCLVPNTCTPPTLEPGARLSENRSLFYLGETVAVECLPGFVMAGPPRVSCQAQNQWGPALPTCSKGESEGQVVDCEEQELTCPDFPDPLPNGRVLPPRTLQLGARVAFACDEGFRLEGPWASHCVLVGASALWNSSAPTCEGILCPRPPDILNGRHTGEEQDNFPYGTVVRYACDHRPQGGPAWELKGQSILHCESDTHGHGVWSGPVPRCELTGPAGFCEAPEDFPFAEPTDPRRESQFPVGTALNYECRPGYRGSTFSITCLESLAWSGAEGLCRRRSCGAPPEPHNGMVLVNTDTQFGSTVNYTCNEGYWLRGARAATCLLSGSDVAWDREAPTCEQIFCAAPPSIEHGTHSGGHARAFPYGVAVSYTCDHRPQGGLAWELKGQSVLHCMSDTHGHGVWSDPVPHCELTGPAGLCKAPEDFAFAEPTDPRRESEFLVGTALSYECRPGYRGSTFSITCLESLAWSGAEGRCHRRSCGAPPEPQNGMVLVNTDTQFGSTVNYSCSEGYWLRGARAATCLLSGSDVAWDREAPTCERIFCAAPPAIKHGTHSGGHTRAFPYGVTVSYTCDPYPEGGPAWELKGQSVLHCMSDTHGHGVWSGPGPRCELTDPAECPQPPETPHGQLVDTHGSPHRPGMVVTYTCDPGYLLVGQAFVFCTHRGTWSPLAHHCQEVNCSLPQLLEGIRLEGGGTYRYGDSVTVACKDGYTLEGSPQSQCQANHTWAPPLAVCTPRLPVALIAGLCLIALVPLVTTAVSCWVIVKCRKRWGWCPLPGVALPFPCSTPLLGWQAGVGLATAAVALLPQMPCRETSTSSWIQGPLLCTSAPDSAFIP
ncbi:complement receptor type 1-like [Talpa occidentalis]|uniref:complement receptor type 1-like n=1 Tax=Talpa occidentalis TaxID=50954 RepID=UPI0023F77BE8|nr:complement receptor type 1-like [Talpa occidentalis]